MIVTNLLGKFITVNSSRRKGEIVLISHTSSGILFYVKYEDGTIDILYNNSFRLESRSA